MGTLEERVNNLVEVQLQFYSKDSVKKILLEFIEAEIEMAKETRWTTKPIPPKGGTGAVSCHK